MAISYVAVSLVLVLGLQTMFSLAILLIVTRSPLLGYVVLQIADQTAQVHALQAALQADGATLNPNATFEQGHPTSLGPYEEEDPQDPALFTFTVPYVEPGSPAPGWPIFALLVGPEEQIIASSYPDAYPVSMNLSQELPDGGAVIRSALEGKSDSLLAENSQGRLVSVARPVWSRDREPIGVVYIQAPAGGASNAGLLGPLAWIILPSGVFWLYLMFPIGVIFGVLTTHGVIQRIERLASATARFSEGDYTQRVPISRKDEIGQLEQQFNTMAEQLIDSFAQREAIAEQSARREERALIEQEMSSAYYIQKSLLPKDKPSIPGWQIEPFYRPAQHVGGDLYDFLSLPEGKTGFVIGDATGKGMPSALLMATTCAMLRAAAPGAVSPGQVLKQVNNLLHATIPTATFVTCFYAILDPATGRLRFANAGHNLPYLSRSNEILELRSKGMPLGLMPEQEYSEQEVTITADDCILFYSDGLVEAHAGNREMYGTARLKGLMQANSNADGLIEILMKDLEDFTQPGWEQEDDVTLVVLKKTADLDRKITP